MEGDNQAATPRWLATRAVVGQQAHRSTAVERGDTGAAIKQNGIFRDKVTGA
jgi:hypothetical protein